MSGFTRATRTRARARIAIDGPSGSGKTATGLRFAQALGTNIGVIDTERGSAELYVGMDFGDGKVDFCHKWLHTFSPAEYTAAISEAAAAGFDVLLIDSLSHAWEGAEGALEMHTRKGGNSYTAWAEVTPVHRRMVDAILNYPGHVICTMRSKTEYVLELNEKNKQVPRKVGMAPIQRPGMEYEFTLYVSMDDDHFVKVAKTRCPGLDGATGHKPGRAWLAPFVTWLNTGETPRPVGPAIAMARNDQVASLGQLCVKLEMTQRHYHAELFRRYTVEQASLLTESQADGMLKVLRERLEAKEKTSPAGNAVSAVTVVAGVPPATAAGEAQTLQEALQGQAAAAAAQSHFGVPVGFATQDQIMQIIELRESIFGFIGLGDAATFPVERETWWKDVLAKFDVNSAKKLTTTRADELIGRLQAKVDRETAAFQAARAAERSAAAGASPPPPASPKS